MKQTNIFLLAATLLTSGASAQHLPDWQHKDLRTDSIFGISTTKAYELLKGKKSRPVIVAVIDAGVDTLHEDLRSILWVNPKKRTGDNGTYGWSYLGSAKGNVRYENLELTRQVRRYKADTTSAVYRALKADLNKQLQETQKPLRGMEAFRQMLDSIVTRTGKVAPGRADFQAYQPRNEAEKQIRSTMLQVLNYTDYTTFRLEELDKGIAHFREQADYQLNLAYDPRPIVGDDPANSKESSYGSPDVQADDPTHGTHVAGIIAGIRHNGLGPDGVADNVRVLSIRAVPSGDERDKDIANAIRYAADHGAKVINMSFGKSLAEDKPAVDEAARYALKKDVLLIQAAGNSNENIDSVQNYPDRKGVVGAWIVVGASGLKDDDKLKAPFSNYGRTAVDVFAPGVQIYSSIPGSKYAYFDGTSMAAPVVAGLAALIREYYPKLSAGQVKDIILKSVVVRDSLKPYCRTGGVVNAYEALKLAATL